MDQVDWQTRQGEKRLKNMESGEVRIAWSQVFSVARVVSYNLYVETETQDNDERPESLLMEAMRDVVSEVLR
jgi:hypothetical protein